MKTLTQFAIAVPLLAAVALAVQSFNPGAGAQNPATVACGGCTNSTVIACGGGTNSALFACGGCTNTMLLACGGCTNSPTF